MKMLNAVTFCQFLTFSFDLVEKNLTVKLKFTVYNEATKYKPFMCIQVSVLPSSMAI